MKPNTFLLNRHFGYRALALRRISDSIQVPGPWLHRTGRGVRTTVLVIPLALWAGAAFGYEAPEKVAADYSCLFSKNNDNDYDGYGLTVYSQIDKAVAACKQKRHGQILKILDQLDPKVLGFDSKRSYYRMRAQAFSKTQRYREAIAELEKRITVAAKKDKQRWSQITGNIYSLIWIADLYNKLGDPDTALRTAERAVEVRADHFSHPYDYRAKLHWVAKRHALALADRDRAIELYTHDKDPLHKAHLYHLRAREHLTIAQSLQGHDKLNVLHLSIRDASEAVRLNPKYAGYSFLRALAYSARARAHIKAKLVKLARSDLEQVVADAGRTLALEPRLNDMRGYKAAALDALGRPVEAIASYRAFLAGAKPDPNNHQQVQARKRLAILQVKVTQKNP